MKGGHFGIRHIHCMEKPNRDRRLLITVVYYSDRLRSILRQVSA